MIHYFLILNLKKKYIDEENISLKF